MNTPDRFRRPVLAALPAFAALLLLVVVEAIPAEAPPPPAAPAVPAPPPAAPAAPPTPVPPTTPPRCDAPEHRQFDFWVGDWDVFRPDGRPAGTNSIRLIIQDCVLHENWTGAGGVQGTSLNIYDRTDGRWHQSWVDSTGSRLDLSGGLRDGSMILSGESAGADGARSVERITWTPLDGGRVRQLWEQSADGGRTWSVAFDGTYVRRRAGEKPGAAAKPGAAGAPAGGATPAADARPAS